MSTLFFMSTLFLHNMSSDNTITDLIGGIARRKKKRQSCHTLTFKIEAISFR